MKLFTIFACLSVLFAVSLAIPGGFRQNEEMSNSNELEEKRSLTALAIRATIGAAIKAVCWTEPPGIYASLCNCGNFVFGDEELMVPNVAQKRGFDSLIATIKKGFADGCKSGSFIRFFMGGLCDCLEPIFGI